MATYSGQDGHVKLGSNEVAEMASWTLNISANEVPINVFGTSWNKTQQGIKSWNATVNGFFDLTDTNGQVAIKNAFFGNTLLTNFRLYADDTSYWTPDVTTDSSAGCRITSYTPSQSADNVAQVSITVAGTGPITWV
jgi:predicted secreted protein